MTGLKDCKNYQENISLSLANKKLDEKNEWKFSNQSGDSCILHMPYSLQTLKKLLFFCSLSRVRFYDSQYSQIKFSCLENIGDVPGTY